MLTRIKNSVHILVLSLFFYFPAFCQDEVPSGFTKLYYPNGQVSSEGIMKDGQPDGFWKTYWVTGVIKSEGLRINFMLDSTWTFYTQTGDVDERIDYKYGKRNGYTLKYSYEKLNTPIVISKELYVNDRKEGKSYYFYPDGKLKEETTFVNGIKQGPGREYDDNSNVITLLEYHNNYLISRQRINRIDNQGRKQGPWVSFFPSGKIYREMRYINDQLDGIYKEFNENGSPILSLQYREGKIIEDQAKTLAQEDIDFRRVVNEKGVLISSGSFRKDTNIPIGIQRFYNEEGKVVNSKIFDDTGIIVSEGIINEEGIKEGDWKDYYSSGELRSSGVYRNNQQTGKWTYFYRNGEKEQEGTYLRGLYDGAWVWYHDDGNIRREETFFNGKEDGQSVEYDINGNVITKGEYINGEKEGPWFYQVNDHTEEGNFKTGLRSGIWKYHYEDGVLQFEGEFVDDLPDGKHKFYDANGLLTEERYYIRGVREKNWKKYDELGNLVMTITYKNDQEFRINGTKIDLPRPTVQTLK